MNKDEFVFSAHAIQRMFERKINKDDIKRIARTGEVIAEYPDDNPYPSKLIFGYIDECPVHVVCAYDESGVVIIITAYIPDKINWKDDFRSRR